VVCKYGFLESGGWPKVGVTKQHMSFGVASGTKDNNIISAICRPNSFFMMNHKNLFKLTVSTLFAFGSSLFKKYRSYSSSGGKFILSYCYLGLNKTKSTTINIFGMFSLKLTNFYKFTTNLTFNHRLGNTSYFNGMLRGTRFGTICEYVPRSRELITARGASL
jgi:hypothetical protein